MKKDGPFSPAGTGSAPQLEVCLLQQKEFADAKRSCGKDIVV